MIFGFALLHHVTAQTVFKISDIHSNKLPGTVVIIKNNQSKWVFIADSNGEVVFNECGNFNIQVSCIGYVTNNFNQTICKENIAIKLVSSYNDLNEYVVTGQVEKKLNTQSIQKIRVIDSKRIESQAAVNLKDLLSNELNIRISNDNILGSSLSLQGISGQNIKILQDGIPMNGRMNGNIDLGQINLKNIEKVEIVEGPMSVVYGTDALGGVINLISKKTNNKLLVSLGNYSESIGQFNNDLKVSFTKNKNTFGAYFLRNYFGGFSSESYINQNILPAILYTDFKDNYYRKQQWLPKIQYAGNISYRRILTDGYIHFESSLFKETVYNLGLPTISLYDAYAFDDYYITNRISNSIQFQKKIFNKIHLQSFVNYQLFDRTKNTYRKDLTTLETKMIPQDDDQSHSVFHTVNLRNVSSINFTKKINSILGFDALFERAEGDRLKGNLSQEDFGLFAAFEYKPTYRIMISPALRKEWNTLFNVPLIPSFGCKFELNSDLSLRLAYGKGFRAPSIKEMSIYFFDSNHKIQGNPDLKAEQSDNLSAYLTYRHATDKYVNQLDFSVFYNSINQMISLVAVDFSTTPPLYTNRNIDYYCTKGLTLTYDYRRSKANATIGLSYVGRYNLLYTTKPNQVDEFNYSPEIKSNLMYQINNKMSFNIFVKYTGKLNGFALDINNQVVPTIIQSYTIADALITLRFFNNHFIMTSGVKNLGNVTSVYSTPSGGSVHGSGSDFMVAWGRSYVLSVQYNISK